MKLVFKFKDSIPKLSINDKNLNSEIETSLYQLASNIVVVTINDKNLNSEIETNTWGETP